jgi:hypothetical protein
MIPAVFLSTIALIQAGAVLRLSSLLGLCNLIRGQNVLPHCENQETTAKKLCRAMDIACVLYPWKVMCLQRSAATTLILRRHGVDAYMLFGAQLTPFKAHAWVELNGIVINDKPYISDLYMTIDRC